MINGGNHLIPFTSPQWLFTEREHQQHHYGQQQVISFQMEKREKQQQQQPGVFVNSDCTPAQGTREKHPSICCSHCGWPQVAQLFWISLHMTVWQTVLLWEQVIKQSHRIYLCFVREGRISKYAAQCCPPHGCFQPDQPHLWGAVPPYSQQVGAAIHIQLANLKA